MRTQHITLIFLCFCWTTAGASTVSLVGPVFVSFGDTFHVSIVGDFETEGLLAGGVQILYDPGVFSFVSYTTSLDVDTDLSCPGAALCPIDPPGVFSIVWGQFLVDLIPLNSGPTLMGTLTFAALAPGPATIDIVDFSNFTGGWFGAGFVSIPTPELIGLGIPLPGALWLLMSGLVALGGIRGRTSYKVTTGS